MDNFPEGGKGPPGDKQKIQPVTKAQTRPQKRGLGVRFKEVFLGADLRGNAEHVFFEVVIPELRDLLHSVTTSYVDRTFYGDTSRRAKRGAPPPGYGTGPVVNYQGMSQRPPQQSPTRTVSRRARARHDFHEIVINKRGEAEEVLERMYDIMSRYGSVTVSDLYELTGVEGSHIDMKWGWRSLRGTRVRPDRRAGGYILDLPEVEELG